MYRDDATRAFQGGLDTARCGPKNPATNSVGTITDPGVDPMSGTGRRLGVVATALAITIALVGTFAVKATAAEKSKTLVLTVGVKQDIDSLNPYTGVTVAAYEAWTLVYDSLLNLSEDGLKPIPELATEVPKVAADGLTWTYKLRDDVKWSDGTAFTAEDAAYTLTRMRDEEWSTFSSFVSGFESIKAPDKTTLVITTEKPDARLPYIPAYILQKKQWSQISTDDVEAFANTKMVGTGPYTLLQFEKGQFARFGAKKDYFGGASKLDEIRFRVFDNDETMVVALKNGEIDASSEVPTNLFKSLTKTKGMTAVAADDGSFNMLTLNTGSGPVGDGHPALEDKKVRVAIAHAIDKQTLVDKVLKGYGAVGQSMNVALAPRWNLQIPDDKEYKFDIAEANKILDDAGYKDGNDDGVREMPDGTKPLKFRYYIRASSSLDKPVSQFVKGWMKQIGISVDVKAVRDDELTPIENAGTFEFATWAWLPFADPDVQLSYLTCDALAQEPDDGSYNDAFYCSDAYDALYAKQNGELNEEKRIEQVKELQQIFYDDVPYVVLFRANALQAYNSDKFTGFTPVPDPGGPVMVANDFLTYANVKPAGRNDGGGASTVVLIVIGVVVALAIIVALVMMLGPRRRADSRN
jgi:peptide/nickel transport system substrate-binding protein